MLRCVFCDSVDNSFVSKEHVLPESLGILEKVLPRGVVCDSCNNGPLAEVDKALSEFDPVAILKALHQVPSKKGAIKSYKSEDLCIKNKTLGNARLICKEASQFQQVDEETFNISFKGKTRVTAAHVKMVSRALLKQAFELIYFDRSEEEMRHDKFSLLKKAIRSGRGYGGFLLIEKSVKQERGSRIKYVLMPTSLNSILGLVVTFEYCGLRIATSFPAPSSLDEVTKLFPRDQFGLLTFDGND